jgi:hypothetical protein
MRLPLLAASILGAALLAAPARAADMVPPQPPAEYEPPPMAEAPPPMMVEPPPVYAEPMVPVRPAGCWRYGAVGWGWYPCVAGPPPYWRGYRYGYGYGYRERPYWARYHGWHRSSW